MEKLLILSALFLTLSCSTNKEPITVQVWTSEPVSEGISREGDFIACHDTKFKHFKCLADVELNKLYEACLERKKSFFGW